MAKKSYNPLNDLPALDDTLDLEDEAYGLDLDAPFDDGAFGEAFDEEPFGAIEFADNPDPRAPCVLVLDTSPSMAGKRIAALHDGLVAFQGAVRADELAARRVEVAIVSFNSKVEVVQDFVTVDAFEPPCLQTTGSTRMAPAIETALDLLDERKAVYKQNGVKYYRPWVFLITDGQPQDRKDVAKQGERIRREEERGGVAFFAVGVQGADMELLRETVVREPVKLDGLKFEEMFLWLSQSLSAVSVSQPGEGVNLGPISGWGSV